MSGGNQCWSLIETNKWNSNDFNSGLTIFSTSIRNKTVFGDIFKTSNYAFHSINSSRPIYVTCWNSENISNTPDLQKRHESTKILSFNRSIDTKSILLRRRCHTIKLLCSEHLFMRITLLASHKQPNNMFVVYYSWLWIKWLTILSSFYFSL